MTETSRRALLRVATLGVLATPLATARTALAAQTTELYARSRFARLQGASFTLATPGGTLPVTLTRVSDIPGAAAGDDRRFGLTFQSSTAGPLQGSYTLRRSGFTATSLFVVPSDAARRTYAAVINRA